MRRYNTSAVSMDTVLTIIQTQLPAEYTELEKRVDALKNVHQKLLDVT
jgi:hypothetical protein